MLREQLRCRIGGVLLADAAEIELHTLDRQPDGASLPFDPLPTDKPQQRSQHFR